MRPMRCLGALAVVLVVALVLALTACTDAEDRLDDMLAEADVECWSYYCDGSNSTGLPGVPTEAGVNCMNDALHNGTRAVSHWKVADFYHYTAESTYVFTVDSEVRVFTAFQDGKDDPSVRESATCSGPFRIGSGICIATGGVTVHALAWDGCL
jgi:hypothetical protein